MSLEARIKPLNEKPFAKGEYVLYWMQASQRAEYNHALEFSMEQANKSKLPLIVYFGITENFPEANERHYSFMLEGLKETQKTLFLKGINFVIERASPEIGVLRFAEKAQMVVCDRGYLKVQRQWRKHVAERIGCALLQVESDAVVPVEIASDKEEYSAATLRRKLMRFLGEYLKPLQESTAKIDSTKMSFDSFDISSVQKALTTLNIDSSVKSVKGFRGGSMEAKKCLEKFIGEKLQNYDSLRNDPNEDATSNLSPYLHFGQISPLYIALSVGRYDGAGARAFLEELVARRELGINFVYYNQSYDCFSGLPSWAKNTLKEHEEDKREYIYSYEELENAKTHDVYWNAAQREMLSTGKMHGYMRMYWGKKILEWAASPEAAFSTAISLNNKYELDGRDPNAFTGISWCFGKHDRPWGRRPIFGNIRYMSDAGLKRKFDAEKYAKKYPAV